MSAHGLAGDRRLQALCRGRYADEIMQTSAAEREALLASGKTKQAALSRE
jgi:hypothetical protein